MTSRPRVGSRAEPCAPTPSAIALPTIRLRSASRRLPTLLHTWNGLPDVEAGDSFGRALASGDFNVLYGTPSGLVVAFDNFFHQEGLSGGGASEAVDSFGDALAAGDFDGDGYHDIAVGAPNEDVDGIQNCGGINVIYGGIGGLNRQRSKFFWQNSSSTLGGAENGDSFGDSLAAGDINGDGRDDLAVGAPYEDLENLYEAGAVSIL